MITILNYYSVNNQRNLIVRHFGNYIVRIVLRFIFLLFISFISTPSSGKKGKIKDLKFIIHNNDVSQTIRKTFKCHYTFTVKYAAAH